MKVKLEQVSLLNPVSLANRTSSSFHSDSMFLCEADLDARMVVLTVRRDESEGQAEWVPFEQVKSMHPGKQPAPAPSPKK